VKDVELLVLRHELEILRRQLVRPELRTVDRALLAAAACHLPRSSRGLLLLTPRTLLRWHQALVRRKWRPALGQRGRPKLPAEVRELALAGFGLDSLIEIVASIVVVWQLKGARESREQRALRIIGIAFVLLALNIAVQSLVVLGSGFRPHHSPVGIAWLAATAVVMLALASGKRMTGRALGNRVLETESRVTIIDGYLAVAVLAGLVLNAAAGWWWADPLAGFVIVFYGLREGWAALQTTRE
jgi:hypothetical protein